MAVLALLKNYICEFIGQYVYYYLGSDNISWAAPVYRDHIGD